MKITIYGSGYVGLVTGACLAQVGNDVLCVDIDEQKIRQLKKGIISIYEPGLESMVNENIASERLKFTLSVQEGVKHGLFQFIAVDTPSLDNGSADLCNVFQVAESIAENMEQYRIIVSKSTVPVGTSDRIRKLITNKLLQRHISTEFDIISNPEFLKEGDAIDDFMKPDRIIIGSDNPRTSELMRQLYNPFNRSRDRLVIMDVRSSELTKYAANALLATKISFMNELANMAELLDADIEQVRIGIGSDPRIGYHFIYPGCGYGGSCFPKDIQTLKHTAKEIGYTAELLSAVEAVNYRQKEKPFEKLQRQYGESLKDKTIAVWGLSFKPNTDDMREASSRNLLESLWAIGASVRAYDPAATDECLSIYSNRDDLTLCSSANEALQGADALSIITEWQEFRSPDLMHIKEILKDPVIVDGRNLYNPKLMSDLGFTYYAIGRGA
ncbi:MAG: UDP-glucose/GDP-mannose dehydrogenase family protein [Thiotrichaceae bacterium]|nr:UDP-glucose/GDP-mannose dehydrogenase family protein [Thiotrichaceae bacterium]